MGPHLILVLEPHPVTKAFGLRGEVFMQILKIPFLGSITSYGRLQMIIDICADDPEKYPEDFMLI